MSIILKRVYEKSVLSDSYRVLVDRLWPRGAPKNIAKLDLWRKEAVSSDDLRKWFHEDTFRWGEFRKRYLAYLKDHCDEPRPLAQRARNKRVTLLYGGASDIKHNNAVVIKQCLKMLGSH